MEKIGIVNVALASLREKDDIYSDVVDEALYGHKVFILEEREKFYYIETEYAYRGFVKKEEIYTDVNNSWFKLKTYIISSRAADVMLEPKYQKSSGITLFKASIIKLTGSSIGNWLEIISPDNRKYYIRKEHIKPKLKLNLLDKTKSREIIVKEAMEYLGCQYRWGGKSPLGIDCSGLASIVYLLNGIIIYRDADIKEGFLVKEIPLSDIKAGDLIYWKGHVAIYIGNKKYIHSTGSYGRVMINSLDKKSSRYRADLGESILKVGSVF